MKIPFSAFLAVAFALTCVRGASPESWPQFQGPRRDATSAETGLARVWPAGGPPVVWTVKVGPGFGGTAVHGDEVFIVDRIAERADVVRCLDRETGTERWRFEYDAPGRLNYGGSRTVPTVTERRVFTIGPLGRVLCLDRGTHEVVWSLDMEERFDGEMPAFGWAQSPLLHGDRVFIAPFAAAGLVALDAGTGVEVWRSGPLGTSHSCPVLVDLSGRSQLVLLGRDGETGVLSSFDPETGALLWRSSAFVAKRSIPAPLRIDANRLFLTAGYRAGSLMLEITESDGGYRLREVFRHVRGSQIHIPIRAGDHLFLSANENWNERGRRDQGGLMCLDLEGNEAWRTGDDPYLGRGGMILADGMLIVQDGDTGELRLVEPTPEGFRALGRCRLFGETGDRDLRVWAPPALSDGRLFVRSQTELKCVDLRAGAGAAAP